MTEDVDMDAPQISTLREETTPEPNPARSKFRVKLLVGDKGGEGSKASSVSSKHGRGDSDDEDPAPGLEGVERSEYLVVTAMNLLLALLEGNIERAFYHPPTDCVSRESGPVTKDRTLAE